MQRSNSSTLLAHAASELESIRSVAKHDGVLLPVACQRLIMSLPGNRSCVDCGAANPEWATITYGTLICMNCSGLHRSYGVQTSFVRSLRMDSWSHEQVLAMLEGGNGQLRDFFERHHLGKSSPMVKQRYHTKAALFYKIHLAKHVQSVADGGVYLGREASRSQRSPQPSPRPAVCCSTATARLEDESCVGPLAVTLPVRL
jgi:Putative GTPase activating protein for Arf